MLCRLEADRPGLQRMVQLMLSEMYPCDKGVQVFLPIACVVSNNGTISCGWSMWPILGALDSLTIPDDPADHS